MPTALDVVGVDWAGTSARVAVVAVVLAVALGAATLALLVFGEGSGRRRHRAGPELERATDPPVAAESLAAHAALEPRAPEKRRKVVDDLLRVLEGETRPPREADDTVTMAPTRRETTAEPREAATKPARAPIEPTRTPPRAAPPSPPLGVECEIRWWRGYVYSKFYAYARGVDGEEEVIAESPSFRWRKAEPPPEEQHALAAHRALVSELERQGWAAVGRGEHWYALRLRPRRGRTRRRAAEERE